MHLHLILALVQIIGEINISLLDVIYLYLIMV